MYDAKGCPCFFMHALRETIAYREANNVKLNDFMDMLIELKQWKIYNGNGRGCKRCDF